MKIMFNVLRLIISIIALLVFVAGLVLTVLGGYDLVKVFSYIGAGDDRATSLMAIGLLHAVDAFLVAIVFYVLALGIVTLFSSPDATFPGKLPEWLRIKHFVQLKVILWEAILTTLVVSYLASLAEKKIAGKEMSLQNLIIPGAILLMAVSLYFLKKGENSEKA